MLSSKLKAAGLLAMVAGLAERTPKIEGPRAPESYPYSSTRQDERQRLQFQRNTAKAAARFEREYTAFRKFESERMGTKPYAGSAA